MTITNTLFELSQLAEASYANLLPGNDLKTELQRANDMGTEPYFGSYLVTKQKDERQCHAALG